MSKSTFILFRIASCSHAFLPDAFGAGAFWAGAFWPFWLFGEGATFWPAAFWAGISWAGAFLSTMVIFFSFFCWNIGSGNSCSCPLSSKCFLGRSFQESCLFKFLNFKLDESCLCDFLTIEMSSWISFFWLQSSWPTLWLLTLQGYLPSFRLFQHTSGGHCVGTWSQWAVCIWKA